MAKDETETETGTEFILNAPVYFNDIEPFAAEWLANLNWISGEGNKFLVGPP